MDNQQQQQQAHFKAMVDSLTQQITNLTLQLADANGHIAVMEMAMKTMAESQNKELPKSEDN